jgi:hypothetical protein
MHAAAYYDKRCCFMKKEKMEYIEELLELGVFKIKNRQLYECSEKELFNALQENKAKTL